MLQRFFVPIDCLLVLILVITSQVNGWGGVFNRFSPEVLSNLGYGGGGGGGGYNERIYGENEPNENAIDDPLDNNHNVMFESSAGCYPRKCSANEYCCPDYICVDVDGSGSGSGQCVKMYGKHAGEHCLRDSDCESGLICKELSPADTSSTNESGHVCSSPIHQVKLYGESCHMSSECDIRNGLCCQLQRRHRQAPRKMCAYFRDPLICIGPVAYDQIKKWVEHTMREKRLVADSNLLD